MGTKKNITKKTDPDRVKQEIKSDVKQGQGDITAREAGGRRE